jgi:hypothetical protein
MYNRNGSKIFIKNYHAMKTCGGMKINLNAFSAVALDGVASPYDRFT